MSAATIERILEKLRLHIPKRLGEQNLAIFYDIKSPSKLINRMKIVLDLLKAIPLLITAQVY